MLRRIAALVVMTTLPAHATPGYAGRWDLKAIVPAVETTKKPLLYPQGYFSLEMISAQATIWSSPLGFNANYRQSSFCHPDFLGGGRFNLAKDETLQQFVAQAGGKEAVTHTLKTKLGVSFSQFDLIWGIGPGQDGKAPCKDLGNTTFYLTKDKKHLVFFQYPFIYRFDGVYGRIGK